MALLEEFPFESGFRLMDGDLLNKVAAEPAYSVDSTVTATGTTGPTAYNIRATVTILSGGGAASGVRLPTPQVGRILFIWNFTASSKRIYPHDLETINGGPTADIPFAQGMMLVCTGSGSWAATAATTNASGDIFFDAADADTATGAGHLISLAAGNGGATSGAGGTVILTAGDAIGASPGGSMVLTAGNGTPNGGIRLATTLLGFFATAPVAKPAVTGSRGGNAALASLLTALAALGLITDSTTA